MTEPRLESFTASDGVELHVFHWDGQGIPVVLLHGFMSDASRNWRATGMSEALISAGRRLIAADARGHGTSDKPADPRAYGEDRMAADVTELADHLGLGSYDLVGYSMGGAVALLVAARDRRVRRLVVGGLGGALVDEGFEGLATATEEVARALETDEPEAITDAVSRSFRRFADAAGADRQATAAHVRAHRPTSVPLGDITVPTLVIAGRQDVLAPDPDRLAAAMANSRLVVTEGDHLKAVGSSDFRREVVRFLSD